MAVEPRTERHWPWPAIAGWVVFAIVCVLPTLLFAIIGYAADDTAERTVPFGTFATLVGIELAVGSMLGGIVWSVMKHGTGKTRGLVTAFLVAGATVWGFLTGFLGAVAISYERHPGWDDA